MFQLLHVCPTCSASKLLWQTARLCDGLKCCKEGCKRLQKVFSEYVPACDLGCAGTQQPGLSKSDTAEDCFVATGEVRWRRTRSNGNAIARVLRLAFALAAALGVSVAPFEVPLP